jgi:hypothetical protein
MGTLTGSSPRFGEPLGVTVPQQVDDEARRVVDSAVAAFPKGDGCLDGKGAVAGCQVFGNPPTNAMIPPKAGC